MRRNEEKKKLEVCNEFDKFKVTFEYKLTVN